MGTTSPIARTSTSVIAGVQGALPPHRYSQNELLEGFVSRPGFEEFEEITGKIFRAAKVEHRNLILPMDDYRTLGDFGETNDLYIEHAVELGCAAVSAALDEAGALDEHAAGAAGGVVNASLVRGDHLDEEADNAGGGVELAAVLALGAGELGEEVLEDASKEVLGPAGGIG